MNIKKLNSSEIKALSAYAEAWNKLDTSIVMPFLKKDFHYSSFWVFAEIESKDEYLTNLNGKFNVIKKTSAKVVADIILEQKLIKLEQSGVVCVLDVKFDNNLIVRADLMPPELYNL